MFSASVALSLGLIVTSGGIAALVPNLAERCTWLVESLGEQGDREAVYRYNVEVEYDEPLMLARAHTELLGRVTGLANVVDRLRDRDVGNDPVDPVSVIDDAVHLMVDQETQLRALEAKVRELEVDRRLSVSFGEASRVGDGSALLAHTD